MIDALAALLRQIRSEPDFKKAANIVVTRITDILDCEVCSLYVRDPRLNSMHLVANEGFHIDGRQYEVPPEKGIVGVVAQRREPLNLADVRHHPALYLLENLPETDYPAFLGVPILHNRGLRGVLVAQAETMSFSEEDQGFLLSVGAALADVVHRAIVNGEIKFGTVLEAAGGAEHVVRGIPGSPGIVIGRVVVREPTIDLTQIRYRNPGRDKLDVELEKFNTALATVRTEIERINDEMSKNVGQEELALFDAYLHILDDDAFAGEVRNEINANKNWAQGAVAKVFLEHIDSISSSQNSYLAERSQDVEDLGRRLLLTIRRGANTPVELPEDAILTATNVSPSTLGELSNTSLKGIITKQGSTNSHTAILARAMGLPAVMGADALDLTDLEQKTVVVDGHYGEVVVSPTKSTLKHYQSLVREEEQFQSQLTEVKDQPSETLDGKQINLWVNIGLVSEVSRSLDRGAEGIGLFRTEIPFSTRDRFPTEEEQRQIYRDHMLAFEPKPVTMRTLDIGGDKALPYFPIEEENPFLGWRGIRVTLDRPDIFLVQIRAMLKANAGLDCLLRIMLPMVSNLNEVRTAKVLIEQAVKEVEEEGFAVKRPQIGAMIEVPALLYQLESLCDEVDFLAVGSNDLTQYMLAVSRTNPRVAPLYQEFHPAVLRALRDMAKTAHRKAHGIGICGELAGTVEGAVILVGMGYDVLSMNATNLPRIRWMIRNIRTISCLRIASRVLKMESAEEIIEYIRRELIHLGLEQAIPHHEHPEVFY